MESRRSARVATPFLVAVEGIDADPVSRFGDLSATGIQFSADRDLGVVGTVLWLDVYSVDGARHVHVMAYVVRTSSFLDAQNRRAFTIALEFMPESETTVQVLQDFVHHVLSVPGPGETPLMHARVDAHVDGAGAAAVRQLTVRSLILETSWAVHEGERVIVDITAPGRTRRIRLEGLAAAVHPRAAHRWDVQVNFQREVERPYRVPGPGLETAPPPPPPPPPIDDLLVALIEPTGDSARGARDHLSGDISRIRLPTLCSLFDIDRMTGKLVVRRGDDQAVVWVSQGQLVDVEPLGGKPNPRARLAAILAWEDGSFDFALEPVERPNVVQMRMTALLLDLAREADEAARDAV